MEHRVPGACCRRPAGPRSARRRRAASILVASGLGAHQPDRRLPLARPRQARAGQVQGSAAARRPLTYFAIRFLRRPQKARLLTPMPLLTVPIRSATASCVRPARDRALSSRRPGMRVPRRCRLHSSPFGHGPLQGMPCGRASQATGRACPPPQGARLHFLVATCMVETP